jgi:phosphatidylethanolamine-binding protein (PEBP) family uncharacterized protein
LQFIRSEGAHARKITAEHRTRAAWQACRDRESTIARLLIRRRLPSLQVKSNAFGDHQSIPPAYTADGEGRWPELSWQWVPAGAESLVVMVEDPDAPSLEPLVHAIVVNNSPEHDIPRGWGAEQQCPAGPRPAHGAQQLFAANVATAGHAAGVYERFDSRRKH